MHYGYFKYFIMPFSLTNAPASMQAYANNWLHNYLDFFYIIYFDYILTYSNIFEKHIIYIYQIFAHICKYGLYSKYEKYEFHTVKEVFSYRLSDRVLRVSYYCKLNKIHVLSENFIYTRLPPVLSLCHFILTPVIPITPVLYLPL